MEEEAICLQCGDRGFTNAFVYCVKCLNVAVHRYCLDVIPASVNEFVRWICEACEMKVRNLTAVCEHDAVRCHIRDHGASKHLIGNPGVNTEEPAYAADERKKCEESALQQLGEEKSKDNRMQHGKLSVDTPLKKKRSAITISTVEKGQHRLGNNTSKRPHTISANINISKCVSNSTPSTKVKEIWALYLVLLGYLLATGLEFGYHIINPPTLKTNWDDFRVRTRVPATMRASSYA